VKKALSRATGEFLKALGDTPEGKAFRKTLKLAIFRFSD